MDLAAPDRIDQLAGARSQQRVREPDALPVDPNDRRVQRGCEAVGAGDPRGGLRDREGRVRVRCRRAQEVPARRWELPKSPVHEVV